MFGCWVCSVGMLELIGSQSDCGWFATPWRNQCIYDGQSTYPPQRYPPRIKGKGHSHLGHLLGILEHNNHYRRENNPLLRSLRSTSKYSNIKKTTTQKLLVKRPDCFIQFRKQNITWWFLVVLKKCIGCWTTPFTGSSQETNWHCHFTVISPKLTIYMDKNALHFSTSAISDLKKHVSGIHTQILKYHGPCKKLYLRIQTIAIFWGIYTLKLRVERYHLHLRIRTGSLLGRRSFSYMGPR